MPVLVDGDLVLSDSPVILEYLEERLPRAAALPGRPGAARRGAHLPRLVQPGLEAAAEPDRRRGGEARAGPGADRRARAADRGRAAALRGAARRPRLPLRRRADRRRRGRLPVPQVRGDLGGGRRAPLPRDPPRRDAARRPVSRGSRRGSDAWTSCRAPEGRRCAGSAVVSSDDERSTMHPTLIARDRALSPGRHASGGRARAAGPSGRAQTAEEPGAAGCAGASARPSGRRSDGSRGRYRAADAATARRAASVAASASRCACRTRSSPGSETRFAATRPAAERAAASARIAAAAASSAPPRQACWAASAPSSATS